MTKADHSVLDALWHRGTEFLGCKYAIMGGAMSWVSERHLVAALSNAGGFGVIACSSMSPELLEKEIIETKKLTTKPFGVNIIIMHPQLVELVAEFPRNPLFAGELAKLDAAPDVGRR